MNKRDRCGTPFPARMPHASSHFQLSTAPRGVLRVGQVDGVLERARLVPPQRLEAFVHHCWSLRWDLEAPFEAEVLPYPAFQLTIEQSGRRIRATVAGIRTRRVARALRGRGAFFGIQFRPAAFQPLGSGSLSRFTDSPAPAANLFGADTLAWARQLLAATDHDRRLALCADFLAPRLRALSAPQEQLRDLIEQLPTTQSLTSVEDVAMHLGMDVRTLQRRFQCHVGIGPKWELQRQRLQEAALLLTQPRAPSISRVAATLGYADQAHFSRAFKLATGRAPGEFRRLR